MTNRTSSVVKGSRVVWKSRVRVSRMDKVHWVCGKGTIQPVVNEIHDTTYWCNLPFPWEKTLHEPVIPSYWGDPPVPWQKVPLSHHEIESMSLHTDENYRFRVKETLKITTKSRLCSHFPRRRWLYTKSSTERFRSKVVFLYTSKSNRVSPFNFRRTVSWQRSPPSRDEVESGDRRPLVTPTFSIYLGETVSWWRGRPSQWLKNKQINKNLNNFNNINKHLVLHYK